MIEKMLGPSLSLRLACRIVRLQGTFSVLCARLLPCYRLAVELEKSRLRDALLELQRGRS